MADVFGAIGGALDTVKDFVPATLRGQSPAQQRIAQSFDEDGLIGGLQSSISEAPSLLGDIGADVVNFSGVGELRSAATGLAGVDPFFGTEVSPNMRALMLLGIAGIAPFGVKAFRRTSIAQRAITDEAGALGIGEFLPRRGPLGPDLTPDVTGILDQARPESMFSRGVVDILQAGRRDADALNGNLDDLALAVSPRFAGLNGLEAARVRGTLQSFGDRLAAEIPDHLDREVGLPAARANAASWELAKLSEAREAGLFNSAGARPLRDALDALFENPAGLLDEQAKLIVEQGVSFARATQGFNPDLVLPSNMRWLGIDVEDGVVRPFFYVAKENLPTHRLFDVETGNTLNLDEYNARVGTQDYANLVPHMTMNLRDVYLRARNGELNALEEGRAWYGKASAEAEGMADMFSIPFDHAVASLAVLSARANWWDNKVAAWALLDHGSTKLGERDWVNPVARERAFAGVPEGAGVRSRSAASVFPSSVAASGTILGQPMNITRGPSGHVAAAEWQGQGRSVQGLTPDALRDPRAFINTLKVGNFDRSIGNPLDPDTVVVDTIMARALLGFLPPSGADSIPIFDGPSRPVSAETLSGGLVQTTSTHPSPAGSRAYRSGAQSMMILRDVYEPGAPAHAIQAPGWLISQFEGEKFYKTTASSGGKARVLSPHVLNALEGRDPMAPGISTLIAGAREPLGLFSIADDAAAKVLKAKRNKLTATPGFVVSPNPDGSLAILGLADDTVTLDVMRGLYPARELDHGAGVHRFVPSRPRVVGNVDDLRTSLQVAPPGEVAPFGFVHVTSSPGVAPGLRPRNRIVVEGDAAVMDAARNRLIAGGHGDLGTTPLVPFEESRPYWARAKLGPEDLEGLAPGDLVGPNSPLATNWWIAISAQTDELAARGRAALEAADERLRARLVELGYKPIRARGEYGGTPELSWLVFGMNPEHAFTLAGEKAFKQHSFATPEGIVLTDRSGIVPATGEIQVSTQPGAFAGGDGYTEITLPNGERARFSLPIDIAAFDAPVPHDPQAGLAEWTTRKRGGFTVELGDTIDPKRVQQIWDEIIEFQHGEFADLTPRAYLHGALWQPEGTTVGYDHFYGDVAGRQLTYRTGARDPFASNVVPVYLPDADAAMLPGETLHHTSSQAQIRDITENGLPGDVTINGEIEIRGAHLLKEGQTVRLVRGGALTDLRFGRHQPRTLAMLVPDGAVGPTMPVIQVGTTLQDAIGRLNAPANQVIGIEFTTVTDRIGRGKKAHDVTRDVVRLTPPESMVSPGSPDLMLVHEAQLALQRLGVTGPWQVVNP